MSISSFTLNVFYPIPSSICHLNLWKGYTSDIFTYDIFTYCIFTTLALTFLPLAILPLTFLPMTFLPLAFLPTFTECPNGSKPLPKKECEGFSFVIERCPAGYYCDKSSNSPPIPDLDIYENRIIYF